VKNEGKPKRRFPARLHVLLAREAKLGLVIRKGPARCVCTLLWDRHDDTFKIGQWMRGRIYERRSDLSPDGKHFIYFAYNFTRSPRRQASFWTAISRAPYLKAIALFDKGDCWHGGGLFLDNRRYWLNDGHGHKRVRDASRLTRDKVFVPAEYFGGECPGVYYLRLERDGWRRVAYDKPDQLHDVTVFEKPGPGGWVLRKKAHGEVGSGPGKGCYWDEHELEHASREIRLDGSKWEWADLDRRHVLWAEAGRLFSAYLKPTGLANQRLLQDFDDMTFEAVAAPY
jgi:hypothetical protein